MSKKRLDTCQVRAHDAHVTTTTTTARTANHLAVSLANPGKVHAAADLGRRHVIACTGRTISAAAWDGTAADVTCEACRKALNTGKAVWA